MIAGLPRLAVFGRTNPVQINYTQFFYKMSNDFQVFKKIIFRGRKMKNSPINLKKAKGGVRYLHSHHTPLAVTFQQLFTFLGEKPTKKDINKDVPFLV